ncbi:MAG: VWA-like domain-containing protein [Clostridia bacterium]|nr:VWA-like domain-containing protein [Clostridia bacterium]
MRIQDIMMHLLLKQPFYGYMAASVIPVESPETQTVSMLTSPDLKLLYNRNWYESLCEEKAVGVMLHELLHLILLHSFRKENRERNLWAIACDMAVNEHIDEALLLEDAITTRKISEEIKEQIPPLKSAEFYYEIISKTENKVSFVENDNQIKVILKNGLQLTANNETEGDSSEVNKNAAKSMVADLIEQAKSEGDIPHGVDSLIHELYKTYEINWRNVLKRFLSGKGRVLKKKTCKRESKRFENLPGNRRTVGSEALLALDESGSVSDVQVLRFYNELLSIRRITGASIKVTAFDTECTAPVPIEKYVRKKERVKNGGTDFRPVFHLADRMRIPLIIIFTDGDGIPPESADQKVLWVLTKGGKKPVAFGHHIMLEA